MGGGSPAVTPNAANMASQMQAQRGFNMPGGDPLVMMAQRMQQERMRRMQGGRQKMMGQPAAPQKGGIVEQAARRPFGR